MIPTDLPAHFAAKIATDIDTGCWVFLGAANSRGYGCIAVNGVSHLAHRVAYELLVGPIPEGLTIDHLCMVKRCCNPEHLEPVTQSENNRRAIAAGGAWRARRTHCRRGHEYTEENVYIDQRGHRICRTCKRATDQAAHLRRKAAS